MKICLLSSMHPPLDKRVFDKEAVYLTQKGHRVIHLCPGLPEETREYKGVEIITYSKPQGLRGRLLQLWRLYRLAKKLDVDVYHCNEVDSWLIGVILKIFTRRKCIFDVHEHYPSNFAYMHFPKWLRAVAYGSIILIFRLLLPFTDRLVLAKKTVSSDFPVSDAKKVLVRNFTPKSNMNFAANPEIPKKEQMLTMIHLGLFSKKRGWPQVLKAMDIMKHKSIKLEVIGEINDGSQLEFEEKVKEYGLETRVELYDWMPFEQAFERLTAAHIGLIVFQPGILNHVYAMPHKMFDYMAAGMAVICPDFAVEVSPIIQETECGILINTSEAEALAEGLDCLCGDPQLMFEMGKRGQEAVRKTYNWEAEFANLDKMYAEMQVKNINNL